jgi:hypothetical protein
MEEQRDITLLLERFKELEAENATLKVELNFLKVHPAIAQGIKGETLIAQLVQGQVTAFAERYDVLTDAGIRVEVKYSKLNRPMKTTATRRWNWCKPLGSLDRGKNYHYLILVGEKDDRYLDQYPDGTPYVYFLLPMRHVREVMDKGRSVGGMVQITSNLAKLRRKPSRPRLLDFQVSFEEIKPLLESASETNQTSTAVPTLQSEETYQ